MANPLFMAGLEMLQGPMLGGGSAAGPVDPMDSVKAELKTDAALTGGAMNISFGGGDETSWLLIAAIVAVVLILMR